MNELRGVPQRGSDKTKSKDPGEPLVRAPRGLCGSQENLVSPGNLSCSGHLPAGEFR